MHKNEGHNVIGDDSIIHVIKMARRTCKIPSETNKVWKNILTVLITIIHFSLKAFGSLIPGRPMYCVSVSCELCCQMGQEGLMDVDL